MAKKVIEGVKAFVLNTSGLNRPETDADKAEYPFRVELRCRLAGVMMDFMAICLYGPTEICVVRGKTIEALNEFIEANGFRTHSRMQSMVVSGPEGEIEKVTPETRRAA